MLALCTRAATTRVNERSVWMDVAIEIETAGAAADGSK